MIQQRCNQKVIRFALILSHNKRIVFISPSPLTTSDFRRLTNVTDCKQTFKSIRKYKLGFSSCRVSKDIKRQLKDNRLQLSFKLQWFVSQSCKWTTCVTRGSRSLSTVRVRISRLLGSHFNRMGEVAVVMVSVGSKRSMVRRKFFLCKKLVAH